MTHQECVFCRIARGDFGTEFAWESGTVVAFDDIAPAAPTHVLIVPRAHLASVADLGTSNAGLLGEIVDAANAIALDRGIAESGYRLLTNHGDDAGQTVHHVHFHLLGGNPLGPLG
jgi:histidine triad (HIT) family protein